MRFHATPPFPPCYTHAPPPLPTQLLAEAVLGFFDVDRNGIIEGKVRARVRLCHCGFFGGWGVCRCACECRVFIFGWSVWAWRGQGQLRQIVLCALDAGLVARNSPTTCRATCSPSNAAQRPALHVVCAPCNNAVAGWGWAASRRACLARRSSRACSPSWASQWRSSCRCPTSSSECREGF